MNPIDKTVVKHVALLARLELSDKDVATYSKQLASILEYINKLSQIDTQDVPPTSHPLSAMKNVFRDDVNKPSLSPDEALANAPSREGDFFKVPQIIEGK